MSPAGAGYGAEVLRFFVLAGLVVLGALTALAAAIGGWGWWVLLAVVVGLLVVGAVNWRWPLGRSIAWALLSSGLVILLWLLQPPVAVLGAILMTGYLGGAVDTHVRMSDWKFVMPVALGALAWLGLLLRDTRIRHLLPLRT